MSRRAACLGLLLFAGLALPARAQAACDFVGTAGADNLRIQLTGNDNLVEICTGGGNDRVVIESPTIPTENIKVIVTSGAGIDRVAAPAAFTGQLEVRSGPGNDIVQGGSGPDLLNGALGADLLRGGAGPDKLVGGPGRDRLAGQLGNDLLISGPAKDVVSGGPGADRVDGRQEPFPHIVELCVDHVGPGESYIVVKIRGAPYADFKVFMLRPVETGALADRQTGPTGKSELRIPISDYGTYEVEVSSVKYPHYSSADFNNDRATVNVTPAEGCTPDPD